MARAIAAGSAKGGSSSDAPIRSPTTRSDSATIAGADAGHGGEDRARRCREAKMLGAAGIDVILDRAPCFAGHCQLSEDLVSKDSPWQWQASNHSGVESSKTASRRIGDRSGRGTNPGRVEPGGDRVGFWRGGGGKQVAGVQWNASHVSRTGEGGRREPAVDIGPYNTEWRRHCPGSKRGPDRTRDVVRPAPECGFVLREVLSGVAG
jgi:hypothetical protein